MATTTANTTATRTADRTQEASAQRRARIDRLADQGQRIRDEIGQAEQATRQSLEHYRQAGELLSAAKLECKAIGLAWDEWVPNKTGRSKQYCDGLIRIHANWDRIKQHMDEHGPLGLKAALRLIAKKTEKGGDDKPRPKATVAEEQVKVAIRKEGLKESLKKIVALLADLGIKVKKEEEKASA